MKEAKDVVKNTFAIVLALNIIFFVVVFIWYGCSNIEDQLKETFTLTIGFFGGLATLGAAYIAANLFNDWRVQQRYIDKKQYSLDLKNSFNAYSESLAAYCSDLLSLRLQINQETITANSNSYKLLLINYNNLYFLLDESQLFFENELESLKTMKEKTKEIEKAINTILPLNLKTTINQLDEPYFEELRNLTNLHSETSKHYQDKVLPQIHGEIKKALT